MVALASHLPTHLPHTDLLLACTKILARAQRSQLHWPMAVEMRQDLGWEEPASKLRVACARDKKAPLPPCRPYSYFVRAIC
jgi:hypothetical protein